MTWRMAITKPQRSWPRTCFCLHRGVHSSVEECMKRAVFVLASLLYGSASYAAGTQQRGNPDTVEGTVKFEGTFKNVKSKLCMGVARGDTKFGAYIKQGQCNKAPDQRWAVQPPDRWDFAPSRVTRTGTCAWGSTTEVTSPALTSGCLLVTTSPINDGSSSAWRAECTGSRTGTPPEATSSVSVWNTEPRGVPS